MKTMLNKEGECKINLPTGVLTVSGDLEHMNRLCDFGARQNPKRGFLFVSKVLGKHIPSSVLEMEEVHRTLAQKLLEVVQGTACFIGLAETAVGLGQGVFECFQSMKHVATCFIHSTRYRLAGFETLTFEEKHSHSPDQYLHLPEEGSKCRTIMESAETLVLIDDEISTGRTLANLTHSYMQLNPNIKRVVWVCLTNFTKHDMAEINGIPIFNVQLYKGNYTFAPSPDLESVELPIDIQGKQSLEYIDCHHEYGRTGIDHEMSIDLSALLEFIEGIREFDKVLIVGSGEWMHPAFLVGREIARSQRQNNISVYIQSTTRSPAIQFGAISSKLIGKDTYGEDLTNYLYNVNASQYQHILFVTESPYSKETFDWCLKLNAHCCYFENGQLILRECTK